MLSSVHVFIYLPRMYHSRFFCLSFLDFVAEQVNSTCTNMLIIRLPLTSHKTVASIVVRMNCCGYKLLPSNTCEPQMRIFGEMKTAESHKEGFYQVAIYINSCVVAMVCK